MLPPPVSIADAYLKAIHDRLGDLLDRLPPQAEQPPEGVVELREPEPAAPAPQTAPISEPRRRSAQGGPGEGKRPARKTPQKPRTS